MSSPLERAQKGLEGRAEYRAETPTYAMVTLADLRALVRVAEVVQKQRAALADFKEAKRRWNVECNDDTDNELHHADTVLADANEAVDAALRAATGGV